MQGKLFRKAALEKLSSPERLDVMMKVTSPSGWLALAALGFIILMVVAWSIVGSIAIKVDGRGILLRGGSVYEVNSIGSGRLVEVGPKPGDVVEVGQVVARLDQPELRLRIANMREELAALAGRGAEQQRAQANILARYQRQAAELREKIAVQEQMVARGLLTRTQLMQTQQELTATEQAMANIRATEAGTGLRVDEVRRQIVELESQLASQSEVRSPYAGRVLEVMVNPGDLVTAGSRILTLEDTKETIQAILFVPASEGKKVRQGMQAFISPSTVRSEEYGFMLAEVREVSDFPLTPEGMVRVLRNQALAQELAGKGAPIAVTAIPIPDPGTESGFKWSSSKGPPVRVYSGTLCSGSIQVETKRPISYVIPIAKKAVGLG